MRGNKILTWLLVATLPMTSVGCIDFNNQAYYNAINADRMNARLEAEKEARQREYRQEKREKEMAAHRERMLTLMQAGLTAAAKTDTPTDDILLVSTYLQSEMMISHRETITDLAERLGPKVQPVQQQPIRAPEPWYTGLLKAAPWIVGGLTSWRFFDTMDSAIANAGTRYFLSDQATLNKDSFNQGSYNRFANQGDANITMNPQSMDPSEEAFPSWEGIEGCSSQESWAACLCSSGPSYCGTQPGETL